MGTISDLVKVVLKAALLTGLIVLFFYYGHNISYEDQWVIYESLRNTSSIIFGVMGAWLAIVYPEALSDLLNRRGRFSKSKEYSKLIAPLVYSTIILAFVLIVGLLAPIVKQIPFFVEHFKIVRGVSFSFLGILTLVQLWALILTLVPADITKRKINRIQRGREAKSRYTSRAQREPEEDI